MANATLTVLSKIVSGASRHRSALLPIAALMLILVILIPLPTPVMDLLLLTNITLAGIVLLTVMYMSGPLEFSAFPSLLLGLTLFRLVLNVATTRLILTNGDAGTVVATFGGFVAGGSLVVAMIIFSIIVVIQFVVITKGATRIAEVAARFTLDGMPGKQMAARLRMKRPSGDATTSHERRISTGRWTVRVNSFGATP